MRTEWKNLKGGVETVGGKTYRFRSGFEIRWAKYLEMIKSIDAIADWEYEPQRFEFKAIRSGTVFYTPDFKVIEKDDYWWEECKGYLTQKDITKFRRMAKYYPDEKIVLVMQRFPKKQRLIDNARKYCHRIINGGEILKKLGL